MVSTFDGTFTAGPWIDLCLPDGNATIAHVGKSTSIPMNLGQKVQVVYHTTVSHLLLLAVAWNLLSMTNWHGHDRVVWPNPSISGAHARSTR